MLIIKIILLISLPLAAVWFTWKADKKRGLAYPWLTATLRGLLVFLLFYLLVGPKIHKTTSEVHKPLIIFLQDNSTSIQTALDNKTKDYLEKIADLERRLGKDYQLLRWNLHERIPKDSTIHFDRHYTDIGTSLNKIAEQYAQQNLSAVILASDGRYNVGENPLYCKLPINTTAYSIAIGDTSSPVDLRITKVLSNKTAMLNSQSEIIVEILASSLEGNNSNIQLFDAQNKLIATQSIAIGSRQFSKSLSFIIEHKTAGLQQYTVKLAAAGKERNLENNQQTFYIEVQQEKKRVLILAAAPHPDIAAIKAAIKDLPQYTTETLIGNALPESADTYDIVIAHQIPGNSIGNRPSLIRNKNVWFILGGQSNLSGLNSMQDLIRFQGNTGAGNISANFNTTFSAFAYPKDIIALSEKFPPLFSPATNVRINLPHENLFLSAQQSPLWTYVPGEDNTVFTFGEGLWRWRIYAYKTNQSHEAFDELVRQTLRFLSNNRQKKVFSTELLKRLWSENEQISIHAYLRNQNNELTNLPDAEIKITDSGQAKTYRFDFERIGNAYRADIGALPLGHYQYIASCVYKGQRYSDKGELDVKAQAIESMETGCDYPLLYTFASQQGGHTFFPDQLSALADSIRQNNQIRPLITETEEYNDLIHWKWIFFLILFLATIDWLLRKYWMAM